MRLPKHLTPVLYGGLLSAIMVTVVSAAVLLMNQGMVAGFVSHWFRSAATIWPIAFSTLLIVAPLVRRTVEWLTSTGPTD